MTTPKAAEVHFTPDQDRGHWLHVTPGERFKIRVSSAQTMGAYSVIEIVADPGNGVPLHIHNKEDEHFIVVESTLDIANGDRRWERACRHKRYCQEGSAACVVQSIGHAAPHVGGFFARTDRRIIQSDGGCRRRRKDHGHRGPLRHEACWATSARDGAFDPLAAEIADSRRVNQGSNCAGMATPALPAAFTRHVPR
jgi:hypothetical protein